MTYIRHFDGPMPPKSLNAFIVTEVNSPVGLIHETNNKYWINRKNQAKVVALIKYIFYVNIFSIQCFVSRQYGQ
jgi:hypothetical protein